MFGSVGIVYLLNILVAIGFLVSAYSPYISRSVIRCGRVLGCFSLFCFLLILFYICVGLYQMAVCFFLLLVLVAGWSKDERLSAGIRRETGRRRGN